MKMERANLTKRNGLTSSLSSGTRERSHQNLARSNGRTEPHKNKQQANIKSRQHLQRKPRKPKAEPLTCRYCGSDDLAPSFIKRRDRRCPKCFSSRYRSAAPAKNLPNRK